MIHIQKFLDRLKNMQSQGAKDVVMSVHEANSLHQDITKLLLELKKHQETSSTEQKTDIELKGEDF